MDVVLLGIAGFVGLLGLGLGARSLHRRWREHREQASERFESVFPDFQARWRALQADAEPFTAYRSYLTTPQGQELLPRIHELESGVKRLYRRVERHLPAEQRDRLDDLLSSVRKLGVFLHDYNERFVEREIQRHKGLWVVDWHKGLELNDQQKKAVVRDDKHNLVIAGAGSGKTAALVYRVAYLTERENPVLPERILAITYTRKAAEEMATRLEDQFGVEGIPVTTFHALGYHIVEEAEGRKPDVIDENKRRRFVQRLIEEETADSSSELKRHFYEFLKHYYDEHVEEADFATKEEYVQHLREARYTTLRGEEVKSMAEKTIADVLLVHEVPYEYEEPARWIDTGKERRSYQPDFHIPKEQLYIEHWGVNHQGDVAPWFTSDSSEYVAKMEWAREQFEASDDHDLVETYHYEWARDTLKEDLMGRLEEQGVAMEEMPYERFVEEIFDLNKNIYEIVRLVLTFINNAKVQRISPAEIPARLRGETRKVRHFGMVAKIVYERYQKHLLETGQVDFADMIHRAIDHMRAHPDEYRKRYDQVLVDEFQDVSADRVEFLQALVADGPAKLFCVGDDWQSIFSFSGADVHYFIDFEKAFPEPTVTHIEANYRCPRTVLDAGNKLIGHNEHQIEKRVRAESARDCTPEIHELPDLPDHAYAGHLIDYTVELVTEIVRDKGTEPDEVMVLCRFNFYYEEIEKRLNDRDIEASWGKRGGGVRLLSVHAAKGTEADHVVLMDASEGLYGFPSQVEDHELIEPVRLKPENKIAEERRLFYVAITRTSKDLYILTKRNHRSRFLDEIEPFLGEPASQTDRGAKDGDREPDRGRHGDARLSMIRQSNERVSFTAEVAQLWDLSDAEVGAGKHQVGLLSNDTGRIKFNSWTRADPPTLEEGQTYRIEGAVTEEWKGLYSVIIDAQTSVTTTDGAPVSPRRGHRIVPRTEM